MSKFSAPYIYTNLFKDEIAHDERTLEAINEEFKESDERRAKEALRDSLPVRIFRTAARLDAVQCLECGKHFVVFKNLCPHLQGKMPVICEAYGVYYD